MSDGNTRHKRKRIWVDFRFQATYTLVIVGVAVGILAALGTLYVKTLSDQRKLMGVDQICLNENQAEIDPRTAEFDADLDSRLRNEDIRSVLFLVGAAAVLVAALAFVGIRLTFRVAGPARALSKTLRHLAEGHLEDPRKLRKGDHFRFLERDIRSIHESMKRDAEEDAELLNLAAEGLRNPQTRQEDRQGLADRLARRSVEKMNRFITSPVEGE